MKSASQPVLRLDCTKIHPPLTISQMSCWMIQRSRLDRLQHAHWAIHGILLRFPILWKLYVIPIGGTNAKTLQVTYWQRLKRWALRLSIHLLRPFRTKKELFGSLLRSCWENWATQAQLSHWEWHFTTCIMKWGRQPLIPWLDLASQPST